MSWIIWLPDTELPFHPLYTWNDNVIMWLLYRFQYWRVDTLISCFTRWKWLFNSSVLLQWQFGIQPHISSSDLYKSNTQLYVCRLHVTCVFMWFHVCIEQSDGMMARLLFSSLLSSLLNKVDSELTKKDAAEMMKKINSCLTNMLTSSTQFYAPFIACLLVCVRLFLTFSPSLYSCLFARRKFWNRR